MLRRLMIVAAAAASLAACATATPYQPAGAAYSQATGGYAETRLEANRWRVNFSGNSFTARDRVETYLLFRAAELTLANGYDWFATADRATERHTEFRPAPGHYTGYAWAAGPRYPYWSPYWRAYGPRHGWSRWNAFGPFGGFGRDPFFDRYEVDQIDRYEATAEIVRGRGPKPSGDVHAFDARDVVANLAPHIVRPEQIARR